MILLIGSGAAEDVPFVFDETTSGVASYTSSQLEQAYASSPGLAGVPAVTTVAEDEILDFPITGGGILPTGTTEKKVRDLKNEFDARIEPENFQVNEEAVVLALKYPGDLTIDQIASIFSYLKNGDDTKKGWGYVRDPRGIDYLRYANATLKIGEKANCVGGGDCDDFAILMAALVESIGGTTRIILARNNTTGGHAYTEVYLGQLNATGSQVETIIGWLKEKFNTEKIYTHIDTDTKDVWLNLDWGADEKGNAHPGGPFFQGDKHIVLCVRDRFIKTPLKLPESPRETTIVSQSSPEVEVVFPDPNLEAVIRAAINKPKGIIYSADLEKIVTLDADDNHITNINGLEYCTNLQYLWLDFNQISDVSPLLKLINLQSLYLIDNQISDVSPLAGLTNLQYLWLDFNQITDVSPLSKLTNLQSLYLIDNQISDVSPLAGLTNLQELCLIDNQISDVSPLSGLKANITISEPQYAIAWNAITWNDKCVELCSHGRYDEALQACNKAIELRPDYAIAWGNKGSTLHRLGRYDEALQAYNKAIELDPDHPELWNGKGSTLNDLGRYDEALQAYNKAIELDPDYANPWANKGTALSHLNRDDEALQACNKAIELDPDLAVAWSSKGNELSCLGRYDEALQACNKAIELDPDLPEARVNKGTALLHLRRYDEALQAFNKAIELDPDHVVAWNNKGYALRYLDRYDEALQACNKAIELMPDLAEAWTLKSWLLKRL